MGQWFKSIVKAYSNKFVSRWLILLVDLLLTASAFALAYLLRFHVNLEGGDVIEIAQNYLLVLPVYLICYLVFGTYIGIVRHTTITDAAKVLYASASASWAVIVVTLALRNVPSFSYTGVPHSITIIHFLLSSMLLIGLRFIAKAIYHSIKSDIQSDNDDKESVLIYGAGQSGLITKNTLEQEAKVKVVGFIDDNETLQGKRLEGVTVYSKDQALNGLLDKKKIAQVIFSIQNIDTKKKQELINQCLERELRVKAVPPVDSWINGQLSAKQIRNVGIDELLGRSAIKLNNPTVREEIEGKRVLITGAAGSIGSEIARQVASYGPDKLILLDQAESALYEIEQELRRENKERKDLVCIVADVRNLDRMRLVFELHLPELIYHAAAYKHVPLMEGNPAEAVSVNVLGTKNVADMALQYEAEKFVMVSTDKAVNPTNVMGATKRAAEMYCRTMEATMKPTRFITTRFGNVLGSNGSVIPLFKKQIEAGGPVCVTHPEITRFFMTIPEACSLVLEAGCMGRGGEIFIFDMGKSIKIVDLAKKMILLSGLEVGKDIEIAYTGLRPGEKLYEELLANEENTSATHHEKIMIAKVDAPNANRVVAAIEKIQLAYFSQSEIELVGALKKMVPEYISKNSEFEKLDKPVN